MYKGTKKMALPLALYFPILAKAVNISENSFFVSVFLCYFASLF